MTRLTADFPGRVAEFLDCLEECEKVVLRTRHTWPSGHTYDAIALFTFDADGRIADEFEVMEATGELADWQ